MRNLELNNDALKKQQSRPANYTYDDSVLTEHISVLVDKTYLT